MNKKRYARKTLYAVLCSLVLTAFFFSVPDSPAEVALYNLFGGDMFQGVSIMGALITYLPAVFLFFFLGDYISGDLDTMGVYVFTRGGRRPYFLFKKMLGLCFWTAVYTVLFAGASLVWAACARRGEPVPKFLLSALPMYYLSLLTPLLFLNLLSAVIRPVYAFFISTGLAVLVSSAALLLRGAAKTAFCLAWPFVQGIYALHTNAARPAGQELPLDAIKGFPLSYSFVYLAVFLAVEFAVGCFLVSKIDLMGQERED